MAVAAAASVPFQRLDAKKKSSPQTHRRSNKPSSSSNKSDATLVIVLCFIHGIVFNKKRTDICFFVGTIP